jgi:hypothetical protein
MLDDAVHGREAARWRVRGGLRREREGAGVCVMARKVHEVVVMVFRAGRVGVVTCVCSAGLDGAT